jgi:menaquinone-dependent protoporphyrinogen oxidase
MRILVAYGSSRGGTEGLAHMVADGLRETGCAADVVPAGTVRRIHGYDAVVVLGGALYASRWHRAARRFVRRHAAELRRLPVYFFSSGPLDDSAAKGDSQPVKSVAALMDRVGARGHVTFGGRLSQHARGFPASAMAKRNAGDWARFCPGPRMAHSVAAQLREGSSLPA